MANLEKQITDAFEVVYKTARQKGPAKDFLSAPEAGSNEDLQKAEALTQIAILNRRGLNPYRADLAGEVGEADFYKDVSDGELNATMYLVGLVKEMRQTVAGDVAAAKFAAVLKKAFAPPPVTVANKVDGPTVSGYGDPQDALDKRVVNYKAEGNPVKKA